MSEELSKSAGRVQAFLVDKGFALEVKELPGSTRTAKEAADSIGCTVAQIAKSLVFKEMNTKNPILVIASGTNRVDVQKIQDATGMTLGKANGDFVKTRVGFAIGGVPPAGHKEPLQTILDNDLKKFSVIWAAAGSPYAVFRLTPDDLDPLTCGQWLDIAEER